MADATNATTKLSGMTIYCDNPDRRLTPPCHEQAPGLPIDGENQLSAQTIGQSAERLIQQA
jgi:hypothetical protein